MGIYMGPTWATHKGLMRDLQQGSMLDPHGQSHVGTIWVQYGKKSTHIYLLEKQFLHIFTQMTINTQSQPIWWLVRFQPIETYVRVQDIALKI